ncbi:hypothetical protein CONPUDRAFT_75431 [Coniophora puteana RWD-64-598 SS2]|uniref:Uncharacterized protein n=1 Tax=Coniophora puteana (strain RWD-64-598) TaxID=741705 RepID=A0A5M3ME79_CONPW|nr:uncharacterized protein CONPUDRAFT_75431 [Coniophora puteana RWD-64-598 SS2]EIW77579.1 hypothetical protein CONPUDRAFT_75431 [Coniophora puteana RWD-64-598 SS2]
MNTLASCWHAVYGSALPESERNINGAAFALLKKKLIEWRSTFGTTAIAALMLSFTQQGLTTLEAQQDFAGTTKAHTECSKASFFTIVLSCHQAAITGRVHVPEFDAIVKPVYAPYAAAVLAASACYRALKLADNGDLEDFNPALKGIDANLLMNLSNVNKTKKTISNYKTKERQRIKKEREERERARENLEGCCLKR